MYIWALLFIVFILAYKASPKWLKVFLLILGVIVQDPIPFVDEAVMLAMILKSDKENEKNVVKQ